MFWYKRHIGDYAKKTGRLSMLEHGAYTLLIDACYDRERFPSQEEAIEWSWARTPEEVAAVNFVLQRFFTLEDGKWVQNRISEEMRAYHETSAINSRIAKEREEKRRNRARSVHEAPPDVHVEAPAVHEAPPNQEPRTNNQEPRKNISPDKLAGFDEFWKAYPRRVNKQQATKEWVKLNPDESLRKTLMEGLARFCEEKKGVEPQYIVHPERWIKYRKWEDEAPTKAQDEPEDHFVTAMRMSKIRAEREAKAKAELEARLAKQEEEDDEQPIF